MLVLLTLSWGAFGQSLTPIRVSGPDSNRFNVVFLSEGYTSSQQSQFRADASNAFSALLLHSPYHEYSNFFNAYAIGVASSQSGSDHPLNGMLRNTYFNSTYDSASDYIITLPNNSNGQGRVDALVQTYVPRHDLTILLVNDPVPGGSDGFDKTAICSMGANYSDILAHETGHVVAGLGDEYTAAYPGFPDIEEPNTTRESRPDWIKWKAWIEPGTPVPTSPTADYVSAIGAFEGAHYHLTNWYRPGFDCLMNHAGPGIPFCAVCREALVLSFYRKVRPIESYLPAQTNLTITSAQPLNFQLAVLPLATQVFSIEWSLDGNVLSAETNSTFQLSAIQLSNGEHTVMATVRDGTDFVRNDPEELLRQSTTWQLSVSLPRVRLSSPLLLPGKEFVLCVNGYAPNGVTLESTRDWQVWTPVATNTLTAGQWWWTNSGPAEQTEFYRAKLLNP
jgi:hypothetical protein